MSSWVGCWLSLWLLIVFPLLLMTNSLFCCFVSPCHMQPSFTFLLLTGWTDTGHVMWICCAECCETWRSDMPYVSLLGVVHVSWSNHGVPWVPLRQLWLRRCTAEATRMRNCNDMRSTVCPLYYLQMTVRRCVITAVLRCLV